MSSFDRDSYFKTDAGFSRVVYGRKKPVSEVELNETQLIQNNQMHRLVENMVGDGISDLNAITYKNSVLTIGNCFFSCSGFLVKNTGLSIALTEGETAYLQVWEETVTYQDTLKKEGNQQSDATVENTILDSEFGFETTRRKAVNYTLAKSQDNTKSNLALAQISGGKLVILVKEIIPLNTIQTKLDKIQSVSRATLSQAGWYRIAEYNCGGHINELRGVYSNGCKLHIKQIANSMTGEEHIIELFSVFNNQQFKSFLVKRYDTNNLAITKIRYTHDDEKAYLEIYYTLSVANGVIIHLNDPCDLLYSWKAITPTLTSETVEGVTVTTTYDIPANASPVTDLDLISFKYPYIRYSDNDELYTILEEWHQNNIGNIYKLTVQGDNATIWNSGARVNIEGYSASSDFGWQVATTYNDNSTEKRLIRLKIEGSWSDWDAFISKSDLTTALANYLPLNGGKHIGDGNAHVPFGVRGNSEQYAQISFMDSGSNLLGLLGFVGENNPVFIGTDSFVKTILHTGNKPSGSYTGNGSATERVIPVGNYISNIHLCAIMCDGNRLALVLPNFAILFDIQGNMTTTTDIVFMDGNLIITTDNYIVNGSGATYIYQVL